jgi:hypothetical protein
MALGFIDAIPLPRIGRSIRIVLFHGSPDMKVSIGFAENADDVSPWNKNLIS